MKVLIGLARSCYEKLLHDVSPEHSAYRVLRRYHKLDRWADERPFSMCVVIECSRDEALELYQAAKQHCPYVLRDIEHGLNSAASPDFTEVSTREGR
jgi:hypothetical protein